MKKNYTDTVIPLQDILDEKKFNIPTFQRNVVWTRPRRKEFLKNLLAGEPFGVILVRQIGERHELIDGLQRISTIKAFYNDPYYFLSYKDIDIEGVRKIAEQHFKTHGLEADNKAVDSYSEDLRKEIFNCMKEGKRNFAVMTALREKFDLKDEDAINNAIDDVYRQFEESTKLEGLTVPAIVYLGPEENIPDVFYNLNTGGVQLTKYETFAALWSKKKYIIEDEKIIDEIKNKYVQLKEKSDMEVDFSEEDLRENGITLFEYCYALGGILREFEMLFGKNKKSTDPMGFDLLALLLTDKVNNAASLYKILQDVQPSYLVELKNLIYKNVQEVNDVLEPLLKGLGDTPLYSEQLYSIYHMIVSYIREYYDIDTNREIIEEKKTDLKKKQFKKNAPLHYLYDCLSDYWTNNRQVSDLQREVANEDRRHKYWYKISKDTWEKTMDSFMQSQSGVAKTIPQKNKLFIDFITKANIKETPECGKYFVEKGIDSEKYKLDIEHIIPQKRIEEHIKDLSVGKQRSFNVSDVGNLCYLTVKDNRSKKEKTLYEYIKDRPAFVANEDYQKCIMYPQKSEIEFIDYQNDLFREEYESFLKDRHNYMTNIFMEYIKTLD